MFGRLAQSARNDLPRRLDHPVVRKSILGRSLVDELLAAAGISCGLVEPLAGKRCSRLIVVHRRMDPCTFRGVRWPDNKCSSWGLRGNDHLRLRGWCNIGNVGSSWPMFFVSNSGFRSLRLFVHCFRFAGTDGLRGLLQLVDPGE